MTAKRNPIPEKCNHEDKPEIDQEWLNNQIKDFSLDDYLILLDNKNRIFYAIVSIPTVYFTKSLDTLGIYLDRTTHEVVMGINPEFFFTKTIEERIFLLCHEAMHVLLEHLYTTNEGTPIANIAQDIVINESLLRDYYFKASKMTTLLKTICLVDTIFSPEEITEHNIVKDGSWAYYNDLLKKLKPMLNIKIKLCKNGKLGNLGDLTEDMLDDLLKDVVDKLSKEELEALKDYIRELYKNAGKDAMGKIFSIINAKLNKKVNWKSLLKQEYATLIDRKEIEVYNFQKVARKNSLLPSGLLIPNLNLTSTKKVEKHNVAFFLDVSGSCLDFSQKFFAFAKTLPENMCKAHFFSFDTEVYEIKLKNKKLIGGGGTAFDIIEAKCATMKPYPDLVIVVTDGDGSPVVPKHPKRWTWFLTSSCNETYIHAKSKRHILDNYAGA